MLKTKKVRYEKKGKKENQIKIQSKYQPMKFDLNLRHKHMEKVLLMRHPISILQLVHT